MRYFTSNEGVIHKNAVFFSRNDALRAHDSKLLNARINRYTKFHKVHNEKGTEIQTNQGTLCCGTCETKAYFIMNSGVDVERRQVHECCLANDHSRLYVYAPPLQLLLPLSKLVGRRMISRNYYQGTRKADRKSVYSIVPNLLQSQLNRLPTNETSGEYVYF